jgi:predicted Zn finger-like uncharacterized protein
MIVRCPDCRANYEISRPRDLEGKVKVRCPRCKAVFPVDTAADTAADTAVDTAGDRQPDPVRNESPIPVRKPTRDRITDPTLARRMARAMLSEILLSREEERARAEEADALLSRFGPLIAEAYSLYGERVSRDLPAFRHIFRDAINDVVGGGKQIL